MPKGISKAKNPELYKGDSVTTVPPVRSQIKNLSGVGSKEELAASLPDSTAIPAGGEEVKTRKSYTRKSPDPVDPCMSDPRYKKAIEGMTALGMSRVVKSGFKAAAIGFKDPAIALDVEEQERWDDFSYVVGKKSNIDPARPWFLVLFGIAMLIENIMTRVWKNGAQSFMQSVSKFFGIGEEPEKEELKENEL